MSAGLQGRTALLLAAYPLVHLIMRLFISEGLEYDEAEQLLLTQSLALGYPQAAAQPPLYTWVQILFFAVFGINVFALAALRAVLQILTQVALFRSADLILRDRTLALLAALSLWLIPQFSVESMRKTHSVLVTCLAAAFLHALLRLWESGGTGRYLWLGMTLGLGVLAKYNFAIFAAALLLASASLAPLRQRLGDARAGLALLVAVLMVAPHLAWVLHHMALVASRIGTRVYVWHGPPWSLASAARSVLAVGQDTLGYSPPVLLHLALFGRPRQPVSSAAATAARLVERFWLFAFGALIVAVFALAMTRFREHWLQPFLFVLPLYVFLRRPSATAAPRRRALFAAAVGTALVLLTGWRLAEAWVGHHVGADSRLNIPYPELARQLAQTGFRDGVIVTNNHVVGGNLRFVLQEATVITTRMAEAGAVVPVGRCLIVWQARRRQDIPPPLAAWVAASGQEAPPVSYVEARASRGRRASFRLGFVLLPTCRR